MRRAHVLALAFAAVGAGVAGAQDAEGTRIRLRAYFAAHDDEARAKALEALEGAAVPRDQAGRVRAIREAAPLPPQKGASRVAAILSGTSFDVLVATPKGYDAKKAYPVVLSLHGKHGSSHEGLQPFALPDEEWDDIKKAHEDEMYKESDKKGIPRDKITIRKPAPKINWDDGLVLAPTYADAKQGDAESPETTRGYVLRSLEQLNRTFAGDPDRVLLAGISMGGGYACEAAMERPDRFAGLLAVAGYDPNPPLENLKAMQVYLLHGDKDNHVPVASGRDMAARLKDAGVPSVYREVPGLGHMWPDATEGGKIRAWARERVRVPWPHDVRHVFYGMSRRCYWFEVPAAKTTPTVEAKVKDNVIDLKVTGVASLVLHLGEPLVDLEKEVVVRWGEAEVFRGKLARSWRELLADLESDGFDLPRAAPARLEVKAP